MGASGGGQSLKLKCNCAVCSVSGLRANAQCRKVKEIKMKTLLKYCPKSGMIVLWLTALSTLLAGCSSSPSAREGERAIQDSINQQSQGRIKLTKFQKKDGAQGEMMGMKMYTLEFQAGIEFTEDCKWVTGFF